MVLDPNDLTDVLLKFAGPGETGVRFSTDTSQALADFINGDTDGIVTFLLAASAEDDRLIIRSREHSSGGTLLESVQPVLVDPGSEGLVAYYEMDNDANDSSGNDLHGTLIGDPNFVEGVTGMALDFDGVDDYVEIQDDEELPPENFTIAFWVNPTDMDRVQITIAKRTQANVGGYSFNITSVAIGSRHWVQINGAWVNVTFSYTQGPWQHVAVTYDGTAIKGHLNGELMATTEAPGSLDNDSGVLRFGAEPRDNLSSYYNGLFDEVMIYDRALSDSEIMYLAGN